MTRPPPPVPEDLDLRDFQYMPLDVLRLRDSDLSTLASGDQFKAAVLLWCTAWHQVPCGSLPNDEKWLARHSGAGSSWRRVRDEALRGFVEHSDGRLYHSVVVEKALSSWRRKCEQRLRTLKARIGATEKRLKQAASAEERAHQQALLDELKKGLPQAIERSVTPSVEPDATRDATSAVTSTKGKGEGRDSSKGEGYSPLLGASAPEDASTQDLTSIVFTRGTQWLQTTTGKAEAECRRLLGSWRKSLKDDAELIRLIGCAQREGIQHPESWMTASIQRRGPASPRAGWAEALP